uniref:Uncharacterized protein n=1 Tax=Bionectria ochroleuca TaxID=29856 RepID=A0A8H7KFV8_BIOOC
MVLNTSLSGQQPPPSQQQSLDMSARHLVMHLAVSVLALVQVSWAVRIAPPAHDVPASNGLKQIHPRLGGRPIHPTWLRSNRIGVKFLSFLLGCADSPVSWPYLGFFVAVSRPAQTDIHPPTIAFDLPRKSGILYFFIPDAFLDQSRRPSRSLGGHISVCETCRDIFFNGDAQFWGPFLVRPRRSSSCVGS